MLLELQVKNLALIEQARIEFGEGLNILTGETGAGKSILIGSVNMALGGKVSRDSIRQGAENAYIELLFSVDSKEQREALEALDITVPEDGTLILSRRILPSRSISRINDEMVTAVKLKQATSLLIDIHGQHEHQSLLHLHKHLEILDAYCRTEAESWKEKIASEYRQYQALESRLSSMEGGLEERLREADFCRFEIQSIEEAALREGEEEELAARYRKLSHARRIAEELSEAYQALDTDALSRAVRAVDQAAGYDPELKGIRDQAYDVESLVHDLAHGIQAYMADCVFDPEEFRQIEERLDTIHSIQSRYGNSVEAVFQALEEKKKRLEELENFDQIRLGLEKEKADLEKQLRKDCSRLTEIRSQAAARLAERMRESLLDLNFLDVQFVMEVRQLDHFTSEGWDEAEFLISTNPGEPVKPLRAVASGGELSRIMLAIKTVLADTDQIPTLIFDEIDTGISGRTAQKVSEKLKEISRTHQVICITHLPQIASMADCHFEIEKSVREGKTVTQICRLGQEESIRELARLLGGAQITDAVLKNAREMKELAERSK
ncbi:MAG TPA: DNA repair protein RecN [Candidatus Caccovicinus merdipullorum]|uniref:DNA repair protein RecN n=1 Tax=Candidatus Caccovicinus merdipullorum TaxID=2840724 RepID=A0A9D1GHU9_9FIRM|nr:DNA repair protein RecN [Candidatus Caccovicinus merdipullorum]